jgi:predicted enzyme related to lactoylglutathione lyase
LHYAVRQFDDADVIALLLAHGASPAVQSKQGLSALDLALRMGRQDIADLLGGRAVLPARPVQPRTNDVHILPFLDVEGSMLEETVAFYRELGFVCESLLLDHSFAKLGLGDAKFLAGGDGDRLLAGEAVIYRCPPGVAPRARGRLVDCCGLQLIFVPDDAALRVASEPRLSVSDLHEARAFYQNAGFEEVGSGDHGLALQLGGARIHLREDPAQPRGPRALSLWLVCDDFDATYRRVRSRIAVDPPQVAFHGSIFFTAVDPDGHTLTFAAPVTDV